MAIIALGVGFFAGIKATAPSMYNLAETYYRDSNLMDYRLVSTVGFDEDDVEAVSAVNGVTSVMPSYYCDAQLSSGTGGDVVRLIAVSQAYSDSEALNTLTLKEGRLPQSKGEIVIEEEGLSGSNLQIGDTVAFAETAGDNDLTEQLDEFEYTIVGMVESPLYISYQRGSTTVGDGSITQFMYILPDNFCSQRYTELYVKTDISERYSAFSDEYDEEIESMASTLESTADARCEVFNSDVIGAAEQELKDSWDEYYSEKEKADSELADAEEELERAESEFNDEISAAQQELDDAEGQIESADEQLQKSRDEYYSQISSAESALAAKESELSTAREEYEASKAEFDEMISRAQAEIDRGWDEYNTAYSEFTGKLESALSAGAAQTESTADELSNANSAAYASGTLAVPNAQLEQAKSSLEQSKKGA
ncbi:MAG: hypothetical protein LUF33_01535 [Clostridiales bacterium]|nr:hypothetical protein [Clostridiales bacterium]